MSQERNTIGAWYSGKTASETPGDYTGSLNVHSQEIRFRRGESFPVVVTLTSQHDATLIRFLVRLGDGATSSGDTDDDYLIQKFSGGASISSDRNAVEIAIGRGDTIEHPYGPGYRWSLEVTSKLDRRLTGLACQASPSMGTDLLYGKDLAANAAIGDVIGFAGQTSVVTKVGALYVRTRRSDWGRFRGDAMLWNSETSIIASGPWVCVI